MEYLDLKVYGSYNTDIGRVGLGCRMKANCPLVGPGSVGYWKEKRWM